VRDAALAIGLKTGRLLNGLEAEPPAEKRRLKEPIAEDRQRDRRPE
jgi:hypothetical protein